MSEFEIEKYGIKFKRLTVLDILEGEYLIPFQLFEINQKNLSIWGEIESEINRDEYPESFNKEKIKPVIRNIFKLTVTGKTFDEFYDEYGYDACEFVLNHVVFNSVLLLKKMYKVKKDFLTSIDDIAKRYGKTPIEILCKDKELYNGLDALLFNSFVINAAIEKQNNISKQQAKATRGVYHG